MTKTQAQKYITELKKEIPDLAFQLYSHSDSPDNIHASWSVYCYKNNVLYWTMRHPEDVEKFVGRYSKRVAGGN